MKRSIAVHNNHMFKHCLLASNDPTLKGSVAPHLNSDSRSPRSFARELCANLCCCNRVQNERRRLKHQFCDLGWRIGIPIAGASSYSLPLQRVHPCKLMWNQKQRLGRWFFIERVDFQIFILAFQGWNSCFHLRHKPSTNQGRPFFSLLTCPCPSTENARPMLPLRLIQRSETSDFHVRWLASCVSGRFFWRTVSWDGTKIS